MPLWTIFRFFPDFIVLAVSKITPTIYTNKAHFILELHYIPVEFVTTCNIPNKCSLFPTNPLILF